MSPSPRHKAGKQVLIWAIKIGVSGGLLYLLLSRVDLGRLWNVARTASLAWLTAALVLYLVMILISAWRWGLLLRVQRVKAPFGALLNSFLVATFFNNFLPSNIGGDVIRIRDTARAAGSRTLATTVVLLDRGLGLLGLVFVSALGASLASAKSEVVGPIGPGILWLVFVAGVVGTVAMVVLPHGLGRLLRPLESLHQEWVRERIERLTDALHRFRAAPQSLVLGFLGAILVQMTIVAFYAAVAKALAVPVPFAHLAILIPLSFIVQMLPISVNGFGVREGLFTFYFAQLHMPAESALALSFVSAALIMLFSISGAIAYLGRRGQGAPSPYLGSSS
ncbi:MAG: lysylphosphatidylglycerol synthase transmembrane domain-containing protein [Acidobacteriota bacterium]